MLSMNSPAGPLSAKEAMELALFLAKDEIDKVKGEKAKIDEGMAILKGYKEPPAELAVVFEALTQYYDTYVEFFNLATTPDFDWSYDGYEANADSNVTMGTLRNQAFVKLLPKPNN